MLFNRIKKIKESANAAEASILANGWAEFKDSTYTSGSPLQLAADTDTVINNDGTLGTKTYAPTGVTLFDNNKITGREGEGILITLEFLAKPTNSNTTYLDVWLDIGGSKGEIYRHTHSFPKGLNQPKLISETIFGYTLNTWEDNGASIYMNAINTCDIYDLRYIVGRVYPVT